MSTSLHKELFLTYALLSAQYSMCPPEVQDRLQAEDSTMAMSSGFSVAQGFRDEQVVDSPKTALSRGNAMEIHPMDSE